MDEYVEGIKSLHIDHLPSIISNLRQQKNDLSAQLSNIRNSRLELEASVETGMHIKAYNLIILVKETVLFFTQHCL